MVDSLVVEDKDCGIVGDSLGKDDPEEDSHAADSLVEDIVAVLAGSSLRMRVNNSFSQRPRSLLTGWIAALSAWICHFDQRYFLIGVGT